MGHLLRLPSTSATSFLTLDDGRQRASERVLQAGMYGFGYNAFRQVDPSSSKSAVRTCTPDDLRTATGCEEVVAASWCQTVGIDRKGKHRIRGFDSSSNSILPPRPLPGPSEPLKVKCWLGQDSILGYLDADGQICDPSSPWRQMEKRYRDAIVSRNGEVLTVRDPDSPGQTIEGDDDDLAREHAPLSAQDGPIIELWRNFDALLSLTPIPTRTLPLPPSLTITDLSAGAAHFLIHCRDPTTSLSSIYAFGDNRFGQCGFGRGDASPSVLAPKVVPFLSSYQVISVACGDTHTVVLARPREGGQAQVLVFGSDREGQCGGVSGELGAEPEVVSDFGEELGVPYAVACGAVHTVVLTLKGVAVTGSNRVGQCGLGEDVVSSSDFVLLEDLPDALQTAVEEGRAKVVCGRWHTMLSFPPL